VTKEPVHFDAGKATIQKRSNALLDDVAQVVRWHPQIEKLILQGHTDDSGGKDANQKLSRDRASAVRKYLIGKGIAPDRIVAQGFGSTKPIASNKTEAGREKNRRVIFVVLP
jgi:outer membrane protein OmpA-like peptidoglycan-associated protein